MNFTREPIIETIITPKEGYKLHVRNSKGGGQEDYLVDAVEVVSFGHSFFFRSLEKPKSFLVPVSDYEIVEVKETRVVLKSAQVERIKIGGGREAPMRQREREPAERAEAPAAREGEPAEEETQATGGLSGRAERRRERHRRRRRRGGERQEMGSEGGAAGEPSEKAPEETEQQDKTQPETGEEGGSIRDEAPQVSSPTFTTLFPPPPTLISETLGRYKEKDRPVPERGLLPEQVEEEKPHHEKKKKEDDDDDVSGSGSEGNQLSRTVTSSTAFVSDTTYTSFTLS